MDLTYSAAEQSFRAEVRAWLGDHLTGDFADPWDRYLPLAETTETSETTARY